MIDLLAQLGSLASVSSVLFCGAVVIVRKVMAPIEARQAEKVRQDFSSWCVTPKPSQASQPTLF